MTAPPTPPPSPGLPHRPGSYAEALAAYHSLVYAMTAEILTDARLATLASVTSTLASHATSEHARLRAELDRYQGREVHHCTDASLEDAAQTLTHDAAPGTVVRATDTGRELLLTPHHTWVPRSP